MDAEAPRRCLTCAFNCPGVCDAPRGRALRAAARAEPAAAAAGAPNVGVLFERHHRYVVAAICRITGRFDVAGDLAQEVFVKALLHIDRFRLDASFSTWLFAIARNCCYDYARSSYRRRELPVDATDLPAPRTENGALRTLEQEEARRILFRLLRDARLDATETKVFGLHYAGGVPLDALTEQLQLDNRSGAKARIVSARRKLHRAAERWERQTQGTMTPLRMA